MRIGDKINWKEYIYTNREAYIKKRKKRRKGLMKDKQDKTNVSGK